MTGKGSAYGQAAGDTDFRKKYDLDEYAAKAAAREAAEKEERKARYEAKLAGKKYYKPMDGTETLTVARNATQDFSKMVGTTSLVPAGAGVGKRGRGAGFYCEACDLTFKDNLQWLEHTNSMQHQRAVGATGQVKKATAEEVHARIEALWQRQQELKREQKEAALKAKTDYGEDVRIEGEHDEDDMMAAMGFTGFGTTAKK
ncbi:U4/U6.U5 snRNP associated protein [Podospora pseudocomata]|uniref:U4/U6.U5 snRNP associated protein n=3 Tax=Podospora TaxID=5144 RepID=A0ABR0H6C8_9PEZI|nr:U4/U6.U5 snRNP associated protein [Podospora bellae-mahoneyi]KAK4652229.1 U4/U6.U5 snRNP associated protein [Podospora pseudocomata]KAK4663540.1 U4/U6.U5 snRNP associated protein [Podospora pseudopauciseta]